MLVVQPLRLGPAIDQSRFFGVVVLRQQAKINQCLAVQIAVPADEDDQLHLLKANQRCMRELEGKD